MDESKVLSIPSTNGKLQAGSEPGLLILLGINFSGRATTISEPICAMVSFCRSNPCRVDGGHSPPSIDAITDELAASRAESDR